MFSIDDFLETLDTGFRIYKCKILLNTIILLNQIKAYLYFHWKLVLSFDFTKTDDVLTDWSGLRERSLIFVNDHVCTKDQRK